MYHMTVATELLEKLYQKQERLLLDQLGDFVKRRLIVIESTDPILIMDSENKITLEKNVNVAKL